MLGASQTDQLILLFVFFQLAGVQDHEPVLILCVEVSQNLHLLLSCLDRAEGLVEVEFNWIERGVLSFSLVGVLGNRFFPLRS